VERVLGIGGVFFKARDPKALAAWYRKHLGVPVEEGQTYGLPEVRFRNLAVRKRLHRSMTVRRQASAGARPGWER
jgi:hypothetical protein